MATLKKYDFTGKEIGSESIDDKFLDKEASGQLIKDYIVALRANARQWSANTKTRSEVNRVKQKAQQQKGLGRARHGNLSAPQFKGGGVAFGPKPKFDQHVKVNKKEKKLVFQSLFAEKIKFDNICILDSSLVKEAKTKEGYSFLKTINKENKKVLFIGDNQGQFNILCKSIRNIPKKYYTYVSKVNGYELVHCDEIVIDSLAFESIMNLLK